MSDFIVKNFRKKEAIKIILVKADKRISTHWVVPDKGKATIKDMTFHLTEDKFFISSDRIPTYICTYKSAEPVDPNELENIIMTSEDYNIAISAQVASEIFKVTSNKVDMQIISLFISGLCLLGIIFLYMTFSEQLTQIITNLQPVTTQTTGGM